MKDFFHCQEVNLKFQYFLLLQHFVSLLAGNDLRPSAPRVLSPDYFHTNLLGVSSISLSSLPMTKCNKYVTKTDVAASSKKCKNSNMDPTNNYCTPQGCTWPLLA